MTRKQQARRENHLDKCINSSKYVTLQPNSRSDGFSGYTAILCEAQGWDPSEWDGLPPDPGGDYDAPDPTADRTIRYGPESDAVLIARSKAIDWSRSLGVRFLD